MHVECISRQFEKNYCFLYYVINGPASYLKLLQSDTPNKHKYKVAEPFNTHKLGVKRRCANMGLQTYPSFMIFSII